VGDRKEGRRVDTGASHKSSNLKRSINYTLTHRKELVLYDFKNGNALISYSDNNFQRVSQTPSYFPLMSQLINKTTNL
jgi:hypothetical protein